MVDQGTGGRGAEESTSDRLLKQIKEVCELAGAKTEEYAKISRKRLDVMSLGREIQKEKATLGGRVYEMATGGEMPAVLEDPASNEAIEKIRELEQSLHACEEEITRVREAARVRVADVRRKYKDGGGETGSTGTSSRRAGSA